MAQDRNGNLPWNLISFDSIRHPSWTGTYASVASFRRPAPGGRFFAIETGASTQRKKLFKLLSLLNLPTHPTTSYSYLVDAISIWNWATVNGFPASQFFTTVTTHSHLVTIDNDQFSRQVTWLLDLILIQKNVALWLAVARKKPIFVIFELFPPLPLNESIQKNKNNPISINLKISPIMLLKCVDPLE